MGEVFEGVGVGLQGCGGVGFCGGGGEWGGVVVEGV